MSNEYKNSFYDLSLSLKEQDFDTLDVFEQKYLTHYNCKGNYPKIQFIMNTLIFLRLKFDFIQYNPTLLKEYYNTCLKFEKLFKEKNTEEELKKYGRVCNTCNNNSFKYFLQKCSCCKSVYYCNYVCQRRDWDTSHKQLCPILKKQYDDSHFNSSIEADVSSDSYDISSDSSDMNSDTNLELNVDDIDDTNNTDDINALNSPYQHSLSPYNS